MAGKRMAGVKPKQRFHLTAKVMEADVSGFGGEAHKPNLVQACV